MKRETILYADRGQAHYERNKAWSKRADNYLTDLEDGEEQEFLLWVEENKVPFDPSAKADYDMRGFWKALKAGDARAQSAIDPHDGKMHYPDVWKTPYHPSFSNESKWATKDAPRWTDDDRLVTQGGDLVYDPREEAKRRGR